MFSFARPICPLWPAWQLWHHTLGWEGNDEQTYTVHKDTNTAVNVWKFWLIVSLAVLSWNRPTLSSDCSQAAGVGGQTGQDRAGDPCSSGEAVLEQANRKWAHDTCIRGRLEWRGRLLWWPGMKSLFHSRFPWRFLREGLLIPLLNPCYSCCLMLILDEGETSLAFPSCCWHYTF